MYIWPTFPLNFFGFHRGCRSKTFSKPRCKTVIRYLRNLWSWLLNPFVWKVLKIWIRTPLLCADTMVITLEIQKLSKKAHRTVKFKSAMILRRQNWDRVVADFRDAHMKKQTSDWTRIGGIFFYFKTCFWLWKFSPSMISTFYLNLLLATWSETSSLTSTHRKDFCQASLAVWSTLAFHKKLFAMPGGIAARSVFPGLTFKMLSGVFDINLCNIVCVDIISVSSLAVGKYRVLFWVHKALVSGWVSKSRLWILENYQIWELYLPP